MNSINDNDLCLLSQLMGQQRQQDAMVAFGDSGIRYWHHFQQDVAGVYQYICQQDAKRWAVCTRDSYWFAVAFFAIAHANRAIILPGNHQPSALLELAPQFDAVLTDSAIAIPAQLHQLNIESFDFSTISPQYSLSPLNADCVSITLYTSGSSGTPKAICKQLSQFEAEISQLEQLWGGTLNQCRIYSTVSHQHIYGLLFRLLWPLAAQRPFCRINQDYPEQVVHHAAQDAVLISSPALLKRLSELTAKQHYKQIFASGGPLSELAAQQALSVLGCLPHEVFGSTETGGIGFRQQRKLNQPWQLFPQVEAKLNAEGCIALRSAQIDANHWYQTADRCELIDPKHFILKGRADRIVKIEEKRVSLVEVESRIQSLSWIDEVAVITLDTPQRLMLVAAIVLSEKGEQQLGQLGKGRFSIQLRQSLRQWLEPVAVPRQFRILAEIPLNSQGKRQVRDIELLFQPRK
jgi:acyl-coenzyme A synthetase/AMP-(fatty) acid ligase